MTPASPIRIVVVDDEPLARTSILAILQLDAEVEVAGECGTGKEAIEMILALRPDLVFLDVQMPDLDGFDVLEQLGAAAPQAVVFVTAYDRYALRAFEAEALDYLLKPFDDARFRRVLERAKAIVRKGKPRHSRLMVKNSGRVSILRTDEIDWIEAADYYACLHVGGKTHLIRKSLGELEEELDPSLFCRIHRSTIVNLERVAGMQLDLNGEYEVLLRDGSKLRLSRAHREAFRAKLSE